jgi:hypothetical protein
MKPSTKSWPCSACIALGVLFMSASIAFAAPAEKKEWAILTYLNGFNSLDSFGYLDMNEMEKVGSSARVHVVSQWASLRTREAHRIYVNKDDDPKNVTSPVVENLGQVDMGDYRTLIDFVKWAVKNYPAEHYFLNVWNHGNGWHLQGNGGGISTRDLSYDDLSGNKITTEQLGVALAEISKEIGQKIDLFGSDSCLMAMAEVVGEMKGSVGNFVGSEEVEPADGWPYDAFLAKWNEGGPKSPSEVAEMLTKVYVDSYPSGREATLSGMDIGKYGNLAAAVRDLGSEIQAQPASVRQKILQAVSRTQSYESDDYKDLGDLVDQLAGDATIPIRPETLAGVKTALTEFVTSNHTTTGMARSQGVSIWFPDSSWQYDSYKNRYRALTFNQDTAWIDAIAATLSGANLL